MTTTISCKISTVLADQQSARNGIAPADWIAAFEQFGGSGRVGIEVASIEKETSQGDDYVFEFSALLNNVYDTVIVLGEAWTLPVSNQSGAYERSPVGSAVMFLERHKETAYMDMVGRIRHETHLSMQT